MTDIICNDCNEVISVVEEIKENERKRILDIIQKGIKYDSNGIGHYKQGIFLEISELKRKIKNDK